MSKNYFNTAGISPDGKLVNFSMDRAGDVILPSISEIIGINRFNLTEEQRNHCLHVWNKYGTDAAVRLARIFNFNNGRSKNK